MTISEGCCQKNTWRFFSLNNEPTSPYFTIINAKRYSKYRLYITADNGRTAGYTCIGELQLFGYKEPVTPDIPEMGNRAILIVTMITGLEKI